MIFLAMWVGMSLKYVRPEQVFRIDKKYLYVCLLGENDDVIAYGLVPVKDQPACVIKGCLHKSVGLMTKVEYHLARYDSPAFAECRMPVVFLIDEEHGQLDVEVYAPSLDDLTDEQWRAASFHQAMSAISRKDEEEETKPGGWLDRLLAIHDRLLRFIRS